MRKAPPYLFALIALAIVGPSVASADSLVGTRSASTFASNDTLHWGNLVANNFFVASGSTLSTDSGVLTTVTSGTGGDLSTLVQCTVGGCTWSGNFAPGMVLLTDLNFNTGGDSGRIILSFATGVAGIGFQLEPNAAPAAGTTETFSTQIAAYDGSTLLGTFYFPNGVEQSHGQMNTAGFYGVTDSAPDITSIQVWVYNCSVGPCDGFAISRAEIEDAAASADAVATPEPASLALLGSGLGLLGFLRRKLAALK